MVCFLGGFNIFKLLASSKVDGLFNAVAVWMVGARCLPVQAFSYLAMNNQLFLKCLMQMTDLGYSSQSE